MDSADSDRIFVANLAAERARLSKANVVRFGGRTTADNAWLGGDELQCTLSRKRMVFASRRRRRTSVAVGAGVSGPPRAWLCPAGGRVLELSRAFDIHEPTPVLPQSLRAACGKIRFNSFSASARVKVFLSGRFFWAQSAASSGWVEICELVDQSVSQRLRLVRCQHDPRGPDHLALPTDARRGERPSLATVYAYVRISRTGVRDRRCCARRRSGASRSSSPAGFCNEGKEGLASGVS